MELSSERRALLAFFLSVIVLLVWSRFYKPPVPPPQKKPAPAAAIAPMSVPVGAPAPVVSPPSAAVVRGSREETIVIASDLYRVELSNRGGVVRSWRLKKYLNGRNPPQPLDLVNAAAAEQVRGWPFSLVLQDPKLEARTNSALFEFSRGDNCGRSGTKTQSKSAAPNPPAGTELTLGVPVQVCLEWSDGHLRVTKRLKFDPGYLVELEISATLDGTPLPVAVAWRGGFGDTSVYKAAELVDVFYRQDGKLVLLPYKKLGVSGHAEQRALQPGPLDFVGIEDQYFTAAFLPNQPGLELWDWSEEPKVKQGEQTGKEPVAEMAAGSPNAAPLNLRAYVGPKDLTLLGKQKPSLEELVQFGWFGFIAKPLFEFMKWMHKGIPNYGWVIVILTLIINTALFPLKMKSWRSMQKVQKVGPELRAIQDRYKKYALNDPRKRKMQEEMMAIYKREGINPMGGCLPMLLQMPIWLALYRMLAGAIELRQAPWVWWIRDLSTHDPYYILPILMTLTMYLMQKMTPATTMDPTQQKMMSLMPFFFFIFFFRLSSGLNLYIFTSNLVGITQQWYLNRTEPLPARGKFKKKKSEGAGA